MIVIDQRTNEPAQINTLSAPGCRPKGYGMTVVFVTWLAYSAFALGWFILEVPSGLQCINHVN